MGQVGGQGDGLDLFFNLLFGVLLTGQPVGQPGRQRLGAAVADGDVDVLGRFGGRLGHIREADTAVTHHLLHHQRLIRGQGPAELVANRLLEDAP